MEIGVRQALGATRTRVVAQVVGGALTLVIAGLVTGVVLAMGTSRALAGFLYGVHRFDPLAFVATGTAVIIAALLASAWPARTAAAVAPASALRSD